MLLLYLSLLLAGRRGCFSSDPFQIALVNSNVCLPCPGHKGSGDVTWWRFRDGEGKVILIKNGKKQTLDRRYDVSRDGSLVISNVQDSDNGMHICNNENNRIYLNVTSDPNMATTTAQPGFLVPRTTGSGPGPGPGQWQIPVAVVMVGLVVLAAMLVLKLLLRRRRRSAAAESDRIYEEIQDLEVETPYYTSITDTHTDTDTHTNTHTDTDTHTNTHTALYSTVNKPKPECVYSLAQKPGTD